MSRSILVLTMIASLLASCGRSPGGNPVQPPGTQSSSDSISTQSACPTENNRHLWGWWNIRILPESGDVEIVPIRSAEMHLNVVRLLEVDPCNSCLNIEDVKLHPGNELTCRVWIKHPLAPTKNLCAFDVRGVFVTGADYNFAGSGRMVSLGKDYPSLIDPDGYAALFNPTEFPPDSDILPALRYIPGLHANGGDLNATLNPFLAFAKDSERRLFGAGYPWTNRIVRIRVPENQSPIEFGYVVDACWMPVENVTNPWKDFPPEANCPEVYEIRYQMEEGLKPVAQSYAKINVDVLDHQGLDTIASVTVEAPQLFGGEVQLAYSCDTADGAHRFTSKITNEFGSPVGEYPLLVKVTDSQPDPNLGEIAAYNVFLLSVTTCWVQTWGGEGTDSGNSVAVDSLSNIYSAGQFSGTVDFDPGVGTEQFAAEHGAYVTKFASDGVFEWAKVWATENGSSASARGVTVDGCGYTYVTGSFDGTIDFDPGPGTDMRSGMNNIYLLQLDPNGSLEWARTWGSSGMDSGVGVQATQDGYVYLAGAFTGMVDFDPGSGNDFHTSNGGGDIFLARFNAGGLFQWARTWGGTGLLDLGEGVAVNEYGAVYVSGAFSEEVDFDPSTSVCKITSNGAQDCFISAFDTSGNFAWATAWGGSDDDAAHTVGAPCTGLAVVAGEFRGAVDFDPGPGDDTHDPPGYLSSFVSVFSWEGEFMKCTAWGATPEPPPSSCEPVTGLGVDTTGNLYVAGYFSGEVDFDPGGTSEIHEAVGGWDGFLSKFDSSGGHLWTQTWGGLDDDRGLGVAVAKNGSIYVTGFFRDKVDFNPGAEQDIRVSSGDSDVYLIKYSPSGEW